MSAALRIDARPRRPAPVPRAAARRATAPRHPDSAERWLAAQMQRLSRSFTGFVRRIVLPRVADFARVPEDDRTDAAREPKETSAAAKLLASRMRAAAEQAFSKETLRGLTAQAARRVEAHSKDQFRRIGIKVAKEPTLAPLVNGWARDYAERAKGLALDQVDKLHAILAGAGSRHAETVARDIEEQLGVAEGRAEFLARDAIGTLNGKITRERYRGARIEHYVWTSQRDDRVRPRHEELDGEVFDTDGSGDDEEGHPGDAPNCRCVAWPLEPADKPDDEEDAA